jgi:hypothetical protein
VNTRTLTVLLTGLGAVLAVVAGYLTIAGTPGALQSVVAVLVLLLLLLAMVMRVEVGITLFLCVIPFLGMFRRMLVAVSPVTADPLLLVIPIFSFLLFLGMTVSYREHFKAVVRESLTARLLLVLMAIFAAEIANPQQGGIAIGLGGAMYYLVPLSWFFIGKLLLTDPLLERVMKIFLVAGFVAGLYGLMQTYAGLPDYDLRWALHDATSYSALYVSGGTIRAFGPMSSAAEYTVFVGTAFLALMSVMLYRRRFQYLLPAAILLLALFLESSRGALIISIAVLLIMLTLQQRSLRVATMFLIVILVAGAGAYTQFSSSTLDTSASGGQVASLIAHNVNGLSHPFDSTYSTGTLHIQEVVAGLTRALKNPWGYGLGSTTQASTKFAGNVLTAEVDIVDVFIAGGVLSGLLYLIVLYRTLRAACSLTFHYKRTWDVLVTAVILGSVTGNLAGGYYALMPFMWLFIAYIDTQALEARPVMKKAPILLPSLRAT